MPCNLCKLLVGLATLAVFINFYNLILSDIMTTYIFKSNYSKVINKLENQGFVEVRKNQPSIIELKGQFWNKKATYTKNVKGWDRFALFLSLLCKQISLFLLPLKLSKKDVKLMSTEWKLAWEGSVEFAVYQKTLSTMSKNIFGFINGEREHKSIKNTVIDIIPGCLSFHLHIPIGYSEESTLFSQKLTDLSIDFEKKVFSDKTKFILTNENMILLLNEIGGYECFLADPKNADAFFSRLGAGNCAHHSADIRTKRPRIENTIALSLARLDFKDKKVLMASNISIFSTPENKIIPPLVQFDSFGMTVKLPKNKDVLQKRLSSLFCDYMHFSRKKDVINGVEYEYEALIAREYIVEVLDLLGLKKIPAHLHEDYADGNYSYIHYMHNVGLVHPYAPVLLDDLLGSIRESLKILVPNDTFIEIQEGVFQKACQAVDVVLHPKGWLSIRLQKDKDTSDTNYANRLKNYLNIENSSTIDFVCPFTNLEFDTEFLIYEENFKPFLKLLQLQKDAKGDSLLEKLMSVKFEKKYTPQFLIKKIAANESIFDIEATIERAIQNIVSVNVGKEKADKVFSEVQFSHKGLQIFFFADLHLDTESFISPADLIAHIFRVKKKIDPISDRETIVIPKNQIKIFLERDLGLSGFTKNLSASDHKTFYRQVIAEYGKSMGIENSLYGSIKGWHLRNPRLKMPKKIPEISYREIVSKASFILQKHPSQQRFCAIIENTLDQCKSLKPATASLLVNQLILIVCPVPSLENITKEQRRSALISIGESATACMSGRATKISEIFNSMIYPEFKDKLKFLILREVEEFKNGVLSEIFFSDDDLERDLIDLQVMHVHLVASAKAYWGDELGLDKEEGLRDCYQHDRYVTNKKKQQFIKIIENNLVDHLFEVFSQARVEDFSIMNNVDMTLEEKEMSLELENELLIRNRLVDILKQEGMTVDEIEGDEEEDENGFPNEGVIGKLLPRNEMGKARLNREALVKILIDINLLHD